MIRSMTGFGRGENYNDYNEFSVEVKTVNHRYNDISIKMPKYLNYLEEYLKQIIREEISRGRVEVFIKVDYIEGQSPEIIVDLPLAKSYLQVLEKLNLELGLNTEIELEDIYKFPDVLKIEQLKVDEEETKNTLSKALKLALKEVIYMRSQEGVELYKDLKNQISNMYASIDKIEDRKDLILIDYKEKLKVRIEEILEVDIELDQGKLSNEIAFFADKSDINEELVRLKSHMKQLLETIESSNSVGRRLDFLIQEMNREVNTIGSKSNDILISEEVINLKSIIEKMREQVQNIE